MKKQTDDFFGLRLEIIETDDTPPRTCRNGTGVSSRRRKRTTSHPHPIPSPLREKGAMKEDEAIQITVIRVINPLFF